MARIEARRPFEGSFCSPGEVDDDLDHLGVLKVVQRTLGGDRCVVQWGGLVGRYMFMISWIRMHTAEE